MNPRPKAYESSALPLSYSGSGMILPHHADGVKPYSVFPSDEKVAMRQACANVRHKPMLHVWLIPVLVLAGALIVGFYLLLKFRGGTGARTDGRTVSHTATDEENLPP